MKKCSRLIAILAASLCSTAYSATGILGNATCGTKSSSAVAVPFFEFSAVKGKGRWLKLAATSDDITFDPVSSTALGVRYKAHRTGSGAAIKQWIIDRVPANGTLYYVSSYTTATKVNSGNIIADPDDLYYVPNDSFTGQDSLNFCVKDSHGQSNVATAKIKVNAAESYTMPFGISSPGFGINEAPPADPSSWPSAQATGNYYIDSDATTCSDTSNTYGYPNKPRCTLPGTVTITGKMVLADSQKPYTMPSNRMLFAYMKGTKTSPAWIVGNEKGPIRPRVYSGGSQQIYEFRMMGNNYRISGVVFDGLTLTQYVKDPDSTGPEVATNGDNVVVRYSSIVNQYTGSAGGGTTMGPGLYGDNVLHFQNMLRDNGTIDVINEHDVHGFTGVSQNKWWVLDNVCTEQAGDCIQFTNNSDPQNVYIGRNYLDGSMENGIDLKHYNNAVVTENYGWNFRSIKYLSSAGLGQIFYTDDEGVQQGYVYYLYNKAWDTDGSGYSIASVAGNNYNCVMGNQAFFMPKGDAFESVNGGGTRYYNFNLAVNSNTGFYGYQGGSTNPMHFKTDMIDGADEYIAYLRGTPSSTYVFENNVIPTDGLYAMGGDPPSQIFSSNSALVSSTGWNSTGSIGVTKGYANESIHDYRFTSQAPFLLEIQEAMTNTTAYPCLSKLKTDLGVSFNAKHAALAVEGSYSKPTAPTILSLDVNTN